MKYQKLSPKKSYSKHQASSWSKSPWMKEFRDQTEGHGYEVADEEESRMDKQHREADTYDREEPEAINRWSEIEPDTDSYHDEQS